MPPPNDLPPELSLLLDAPDSSVREKAWEAFLEQYSRLILHTLRRLGREHDTLMDRYAFVLEQLSHDEYRRLRGYEPTGRSKFSTWLAVVVHRLGLDHYRRRYGYGRESDATTSSDDRRAMRRRLVDLLGEGVDVETLAGGEEVAPDTAIREREYRSAVEAVLTELSPRDRLLLHLRYELDLPARRIAELMGFATPFHVYRRCNHLCGTLRAELRRRGVEDPIP